MPSVHGTLRWWNWKRSQDQLHLWVEQVVPEAYLWTPTFNVHQGSHMSFDSNTIVINPVQVHDFGVKRLVPRQWRSRSLIQVEHLQWFVSRAITRHECGHVRYTRTRPHASPLLHSIVNRLEDGRIERALGMEYPWCWSDFVQLGQMLWSAAPEVDATDPHWWMTAILLHRWDVIRPTGKDSMLAFPHSPAVAEVWREIQPLVDEAHWAPTTERVYEIGEELIRRFVGEDEQAQEDAAAAAGAGGNSPDGQPQGQRSEGDVAEVFENNQVEREDLEARAQGKVFLNEPDPDGQPGSVPGEGLTPRTIVPVVKYDEIARKVEGRARRLAGLITAPAPDADVRLSAYSGTFDINAHINTQGETPFRYQREWGEDPKGLALMVLIDTTGSNGNNSGIGRLTGEPTDLTAWTHPEGRMVYVRETMLLLNRACELSGIPLAVASCADWRDMFPGEPEPPKGEAHVVAWVKTFEESHSDERVLGQLAGLRGDGGTERYCIAMRRALPLLLARPEERKVLLYIMDGQPTSGETPEQVRDQVDLVRRTGVAVCGMYIGPIIKQPWERRRGDQVVQGMFGQPHTIVVGTDLNDLPRQLENFLNRQVRS